MSFLRQKKSYEGLETLFPQPFTKPWQSSQSTPGVGLGAVAVVGL